MDEGSSRAHLDAEAWEQTLARSGLGARIGFGERPALLVIDLVRAFTDPAMPLSGDLDSVVENAASLLDSARAAGIPILFTTVEYEDPDLADAGVWLKKVPASVTLKAGTPGVQLDSRLARGDDERMVVKKYASAFFETDLLETLRALDVDTLLLAGCTTSGCVRATAVDGLQNRFRVMVVREAVGDRNDAAHRQSLLDLDAKYADVVSAADVAAYLSARRDPAPAPAS
jgi:maleamate amidohydrolase